MKSLKTLALLFISATLMTAQTKKSFTLDDLLWGGNNYWNLQPSYLYTSWWGDCLLKLGVEEVSQLTNEKGKEVKGDVLFTAADIKPLITDGTEGKGLTLLRSSFPYADKTQVLLSTSKSRFLYDWKEKKIVWSQPLTLGSENNDFNTASKSEAYTENWNLFLKTEDGTVHQISRDGSREIPYGTVVHRNEFGINKGTFFSPSGKKLAFYRMDQTMVADYPLVDIEHRIAELAPEKYPMAGETSHQVTIGVFDPATESTVFLQAGSPVDRYFSGITWSPDEKTIYVIEMPRSQKKLDLVAYDAETGARKGVLFSESNEAKYVHPMNGIEFLPWNPNQFIYQSERDGYNHLYLYDTTGKEIKQLTSGEFVVIDILGFNPQTKSVIILSTESSPIRNNCYAVNVETGKRTLIDNGEGVHSGSLSRSGTYLLDRWSSPKTFRQFALYPTNKTNRPLVLQNDEDAWKDYNQPEITCGTIKAADGKTDLYYRLVKPVGFDPQKKYPAVVYVYGGPGLRNVEERWNYATRGWEYYMAQKGYVLFVLDNRGSKDRGFEFETATYRHLGVEEMKDQIKGVDYLKSLPFVDADRLGVHGWSFGGFMTTNLMCSYPDVFKVGVAGGPVIDWKLYEVMYGERYMDTPQNNPEGYAGSCLLNKAKNLKGRLQIIHGYNDPVCVPQHTLSFLRACINADTQPDLFLYPNQEHNMTGHDMVHLHERITRYFEDYLK